VTSAGLATDPGSLPASTPAAPSLGTVVDALGAGVVRVIVAPRGLDVPAGDPTVYDAVDGPPASRHDLVLAVGADAGLPSTVDVVTRCAERGAAAVVVKSDAALPASLVSAAEASGIALLCAPRDAAWGELHTLLRTARSATAHRAPDASRASLGDLFRLADAISALLGGAVLIEDEHFTVLAHSSTSQPMDQPRRDTVLGRRMPAEWLTRLQDAGILRRLWSGDDVVRVELDGVAPRLAVAVRAGGEVLGSIWVQEGERALGTDAERDLREAASLAALHLLRARSGDDLERRRSAEQLRGVLDARLPATLIANELQVAADTPLAVLGLDLAGEVVRVADRAADLVSLSCRAFRRQVVAAPVAGTVYAVLSTPAGADEARHLAADLTSRVATSLHVPVRAAVADVPTGLAGLLAARHDVDVALRVLASRGGHGCVHVDDVRAATVLLHLRDVAAEHPVLLVGKARLLQASDRDRGTSYVRTLRAFLDSFGDVRVAAAVLAVHPNTFRYRLRRLCELVGLDLDDPVERLVVQLQLHLLDP
jgi:hypothetical protein